jgi:nitroreductase
MKELNNLTEAIRKRYSCRTYHREAVDVARREKLAAVLADLTTGPLGSAARFMLVSASDEDASALKGLSTYGFIKNPTAFIFGAVRRARFDMEDFGYLMELAILYATRLGLGTCWLGGTFNYSRFARTMALQEGETMPAVTASGLPAERHFTDRLIRGQAKSDRRKPWETLFFDSGFDQALHAESAGAYESVLDLVRIAPSASNKQPWRVVRQGSDWHFYLLRTPNYPPKIPRLVDVQLADLQRVDMGIAMCHFAVGAAAGDLPGTWQHRDPGLELPERTEYVVTWEGDR